MDERLCVIIRASKPQQKMIQCMQDSANVTRTRKCIVFIIECFNHKTYKKVTINVGELAYGMRKVWVNLLTS